MYVSKGESYRSFVFIIRAGIQNVILFYHFIVFMLF